MELERVTLEKIEALQLLTGRSAEEVLSEALESYLRLKQEEKLEQERQETALTYDEFWDGVDI